MLDSQVQLIGDYQWIPGTAWPQPDYVVRAPLSRFDTAFKVAEPGIRGVEQISYSVPQYTFKANQNLPVAAAKQTSLGTLNGAAPTSGIYTGIPSGCSNGMGGNPYS